MPYAARASCPRVATDMESIGLLLSRYGYLMVFLAGLAEALPFLGWLVPGQAIIILAGAAAAAGLLDLRLIILVSIPAGIVGDAIGFYVGRRYGRAFLERYGPRFRIGPRHLERSDRLFAKYGPFALVLARFSFLTRAVGPILAGMARMRQRVFWPINVLGAVLWSVSYAVLGYFFGVGFLYVQGTIGRILAFTLLGVVGIYAFYRVLKKYADQFTRDDFYVALVGAVSGAVFGVLADRVAKLGPANPLDARAGQVTDAIVAAAPLWRALETLVSFPVLGTLSLGLLAYLAARRHWWDAALVGLGVGGIMLLLAILRAVFRNVLPPGSGESWPSSVAAAPLVLAGVLAYLVAQRSARPHAPIAAALGGALVVGAAMLARLGQGLEPPSAVLAGLLLGAAWLSVTVLVIEFRLKRTPRAATA